MPELPEVELIRKKLEKYLKGHGIKEVDIKYKKCFRGKKDEIVGGKVIRVRRFGKVLSIDLSNGYSVIIHIKLTGQLIYRGLNLKHPPRLPESVKDGLEGKHTHAVFYLDKGGMLYFIDVRKFGWIDTYESSKIESGNIFVKNLGPEPFRGLTRQVFREILKSDRAVKTLLMDQKKIAGIGNIYANEALWLAGINPETKAIKLDGKKVKRLFDSIEKVLKESLKKGGASDNSFLTPDGRQGNYQKHFLVYGRKGKKCLRCEGKIKREKVSGRGTYFCPRCQKI